MSSRRACTTHTPHIWVTYRWHCCRPHDGAKSRTSNTYTSTTHFLQRFTTTDFHPYKVPGYIGQPCTVCLHPACHACTFLEVSRVDGTHEGMKDDDRAPWEGIGLWDERQVSQEGWLRSKIKEVLTR